jgi:hypothetical protein
MKYLALTLLVMIFSFRAQAECIKQPQITESLNWPGMETISLSEADEQTFREFLKDTHGTITPADTFVVFSSPERIKLHVVGFVLGCTEGWMRMTRDEFNAAIGARQ